MPARNGPRPDQISQPTGTTPGDVLTAGATVPSFQPSTGGSSGAAAPTGPISVTIPLTTPLLPGSETILPPPAVILGDLAAANFADGITYGEKFEFSVPDNYDSGSIEILMTYQMSTIDSGTPVNLEVDLTIADITIGTIDNPPGRTAIVITPPNAIQVTREVLFIISEGDFNAGDAIVVTVIRPGDVTGDHSGDLYRINYSYRYTGQIQTAAISLTSDLFFDTDELPATPSTLFDFETMDFPSGLETEAKVLFQIPDHWDETSDAHFRFTYAMETPDIDAEVLISTEGQIANTDTGTIDSFGAQTFLIKPPNDASVNRTVIVRSIQSALINRGDSIALKVARRLAGTGEHSGTLKLISVTMTLGIIPSTNFGGGPTEGYLISHNFNQITPTVDAEISNPDFSGDFETWFTMTGLSASDRVDIQFQGRLNSDQTFISTIEIPVNGTGEYRVRVYVEGSGATNVYSNSILLPATGTEGATINIISSELTAQPMGNKKYFVVVEAFVDASEVVQIGRPFVRQF